MPRATKIVATLGPASNDKDRLHDLIVAGVDVVRLNFSHGSTQEHQLRAQSIREISRELGREVAIIVDLQGPKIRIGTFVDGHVNLTKGQSFILDAHLLVGNREGVGLDYPDLPSDVAAGDLLLLDDGLIRLQVEQVQDHVIKTRVVSGGELFDHKGINRLGGGLSAPALTEKDRHDMVTALSLQADYIAVSFPRNAADILEARRCLEAARDQLGLNSTFPMPGIIAKIERAEAVLALEEILQASEGVMVARGDLAVEVGNAAVPAIQKRMIRMAREANKIVITATQMMESMIHQAMPTRAEVSDVANAVLDGTDAVMLSAETAVGRYPVETVQAMAAICFEAEKSDPVVLERDFLNASFSRIDQTIAYGALFTAYHLHCSAICALTESGATPLWMSRHAINMPIYAFTPNLATQRKLALYRNVHALPLPASQHANLALNAAQQSLIKRKLLGEGELIVLTICEPMDQSGGTNTLKIVRLNSQTHT